MVNLRWPRMQTLVLYHALEVYTEHFWCAAPSFFLRFQAITKATRPSGQILNGLISILDSRMLTLFLTTVDSWLCSSSFITFSSTNSALMFKFSISICRNPAVFLAKLKVFSSACGCAGFQCSEQFGPCATNWLSRTPIRIPSLRNHRGIFTTGQMFNRMPQLPYPFPTLTLTLGSRLLFQLG